ncbi:MAG: Holliday junction resolvase RuvX [Candidatus Calescibacterium sp.]|nr:Holliday junction resolvase RuvX [Candidatus Calescibacterium sp.]MCX7971933.1 Holliday junction resolvase RuvX [bacterium]MDW8194968.1 Holliday junction resolvase RuvX [Candidatus Calescibacterium sp.]
MSVFKYYLGIDPGTHKVGIAIANHNKQMVYKTIVKFSSILDTIQSLVEEYDIEDIILGNGSNYKKVLGMINIIKIARVNQKKKLNIHIVDEKNSSIEARKIFISKEKSIIGKIICYLRSLFIDIDDYSAFVLVCRFISNKGNIKKQIYNL